jgi:hypothetical protein
MTGRKTVVNAIVLASILFGVTWLGCNKDEVSNTQAARALAPVSAVGAFSKNLSTVGLAWTASSDAGQTDFLEHQITVKRGSTTEQTLAAPKNATSYDVAGLTEGAIYTFEIVAKAVANSSSFTNSSVASVVWSPARRYENESGYPPPIQVYETSSPTSYASGLIFYKGTFGPQTISVLDPDSSLIDVYVKTEVGNAVSLNSSHLFRAGRRITRFSTTVRDDNTLNNPQLIPPDTTTFNNSSVLFDSVQVSSSKIYYFKGNDGNYGRILVERSPAGRLIWGTSPIQYLSVRISYQTVAFNPYAKPIRISTQQGGNHE